jgi:hypothetical protein
MMIAVTRKMMAITAFVCLFFVSYAQGTDPGDKAAKPYRIYTSGKQITVKSSNNIKSVMVWTASGHRIVEEKGLNTASYSFTIDVNEKVFFLMLDLGNKRYTEKIGVR